MMLLSIFVTLFAAQNGFDKGTVEVFGWIDSLGFSEDLNKPFVKVTDRRWPEQAEAYGFIVGKTDHSISVLLPNLATVKYETLDKAPYWGDYSYVESPVKPEFMVSRGAEVHTMAAAWILARKGLSAAAKKVVAKQEKYQKENFARNRPFFQLFARCCRISHRQFLFFQKFFLRKVF